MLTKNFNLSEFNSNDGAVMPDDVRQNIEILANNLQILRDYFNAPITINSGWRSTAHNHKVGGVKDSQHLFGRAADITVQGFTPVEVRRAIRYLIANGQMEQGGIGLYENFVHYDIRGYMAEWTDVKKKSLLNSIVDFITAFGLILMVYRWIRKKGLL